MLADSVKQTAEFRSAEDYRGRSVTNEQREQIAEKIGAETPFIEYQSPTGEPIETSIEKAASIRMNGEQTGDTRPVIYWANDTLLVADSPKSASSYYFMATEYGLPDGEISRVTDSLELLDDMQTTQHSFGDMTFHHSVLRND